MKAFKIMDGPLSDMVMLYTPVSVATNNRKRVFSEFFKGLVSDDRQQTLTAEQITKISSIFYYKTNIAAFPIACSKQI